MKIALVCPEFLPQIGGAEFVAHHLARHWSQQGHEVRVMNFFTAEATHANGEYTVRQYKLARGSTRLGYHRFPFTQIAERGIRKLLGEFRPDFISSHFGYPTAVWLSRLSPRPRYLVTCHGSDLTKAAWGHRALYGIDELMAAGLNASSGAIAISTEARRLMEEIGVAPSKILDIPNGVDLVRFQAPVGAFELRAKLGLPADAVVILSVGREHSTKGYATGIKAFSKIAARAPKAHYVLLGKDTNIWRGLGDELGLSSQLVFCEGLYGEELVAAYRQADVFFSPSLFEMFSLVVIEAMAAGLPEVVTNISGSQDVIHTGDNGLVVEPGDIDGMAEALGRLATDAALRKRMGEANRERSRSYGWDRISRLYLEHA